MAVRCDEYNRVCVLSVEGDLSADNAKLLRNFSEDRIDNRRLTEFVVDLEKCPFVDSEGLETLLHLRRRCDELFGQVKLVCLDDNCRKILELTRLEHRFEINRDLPSALKTMR
jgi:anti-anti-sigma factor